MLRHIKLFYTIFRVQSTGIETASGTVGGEKAKNRCAIFLSQSLEYAGAIWALVDVDASKFDAKPERINISLPRFVLRKIDNFAEERHETRSGFISRAALALIAEETARA